MLGFAFEDPNEEHESLTHMRINQISNRTSGIMTPNIKNLNKRPKK